MNTHASRSNSVASILLLLILSGWVLSAVPAGAQGTGFTYQGRVVYQGFSANGNYDLTFALFDAASGPNQIGSTITNLNLAVSNGLFTVTLDFGASAFPGPDRWLELGVRTNGSDPFVTLSPRQQLTAAPYAVTALSASTVASGVSNAFYLASNPSGFISANQPITLSGDVSGSGATSIEVTVNNVRGTLTNSITGNAASATTASAVASAVSNAFYLASNPSGFISGNQTITLSGGATGSGTTSIAVTVPNQVPQGGIIIWSGAANNIPSGWGLCDGTQGTPDLRDKFVVGAGSTYAVAAAGGATTHTHDTAIGAPTTSTAGAHTHTTTATTTGTGTTGTGTTGTESGHTHAVDVASFTSGAGTAHTHGWGTLTFGRQVDFTGAGGSSGGPWIISVFSGSSTSPQFGMKFSGGATASESSHTHTINPPSTTSGAGTAHSHSIPGLSIPGLSVPALSIPALATSSSGDHSHTVTIGTLTSTSASSLPPYYALCYIMKL